MSIILKFIIRNICEKKFRTFLIVFSIMISTALFFASSAISDTMVKMVMEQNRNSYGSSDILIKEGFDSPSPFFKMEKAERYKEHFEYIAGSVLGSPIYKFGNNEIVNITAQGITLEDSNLMNPIVFEEQLGLYPFSGNKIIISKATAQNYNMKLGDNIQLDFSGQKHRFVIVGIAYPIGPFEESGKLTYAIMPKETLASIYNAKGSVNLICIKLKDISQKQQMIKELSGEYKRFTVKEPLSKEEVQQKQGPIGLLFTIVTVIVLFISIFIIYSSFKVITMERLPVIGTFRSVGATKKETTRVLLMESAIYGILGGIVGCGIGIVVLYAMAKVVYNPEYQRDAAIEFKSIQILSAFILAIVLSLTSSIIPILKVSKIPIKDIVLNVTQKGGKKRKWNLGIGIFFLLFTAVSIFLLPKKEGLPAEFLSIILSLSGVILLTPYITKLFVKVFENAFVFIFGNEGVLAVKNLRENESILNNISLLAIGISSLLMINAISASVINVSSGLYTNTVAFDVDISGENLDKNFERSLMRVEGVSDVYGQYMDSTGIEVVEYKEKINWVLGVDKNKFEQYWKVDIPGDKKEILSELDQGRNILLTSTLKDKFGVKKGDKITLKMRCGERQYRIAGFYDTLLYMGNMALVPDKYFKLDMGMQEYSEVTIKTSMDPEKVQNNIKKQFPRKKLSLTTKDDMQRSEKESFERIFSILKGFSVMTMIIGIFGVLNNLIICFMDRRRSFAMLKSVGMSKKQTIKMIFIEALSAGFIGGFIGILAGVLLITVLQSVLTALSVPIPIKYDIDLLINSMISGIIITLVASISPALKSSRLNIIESLKYE